MSNATITIFGPDSVISGDYPKNVVGKATAYFVDGAQFSKAYKRGVWDGYTKLLSAKTGAFPTGLVPDVVAACKEHGYAVDVVDKRVFPEPARNSFDLEVVTLRDYQLGACEAAVAAGSGILKMATGAGKSACAVAITKYYWLNTLFMVDSKELMFQAQKSFAKFLGVNLQDIGLIGDGHWDPKLITVAIVDTLESRIKTKDCLEYLAEVDVMFIDECHSSGAESVFTVATMCNAVYRFGLSATPLDRSDSAGLRTIGAVGKIIYEVKNKLLVERGILPKANIIFSSVTQPLIKRKTPYSTVYKQGIVENEQLLELVVDWTKAFVQNNLSVLILVEEIGHGNRIDDALWTQTGGIFIPHKFIHGSESTEERSNTLDDFDKRRLPVMIASTIMDTGVDTSAVDALILAGSRKSKIKTLQRLGRGLRGDKLIAIEFSNFCNDFLLRHGLERLEDYKAEDCFTILQSQPDAELVRKLWSE